MRALIDVLLCVAPLSASKHVGYRLSSQFVYCMLVGTFPFNSFLAGFSSTVGAFVLTGENSCSRDQVIAIDTINIFALEPFGLSDGLVSSNCCQY